MSEAFVEVDGSPVMIEEVTNKNVLSLLRDGFMAKELEAAVKLPGGLFMVVFNLHRLTHHKVHHFAKSVSGEVMKGVDVMSVSFDLQALVKLTTPTPVDIF